MPGYTGDRPGIAPIPGPPWPTPGKDFRGTFQPQGDPSTYPARAAVRVDATIFGTNGKLAHFCSGTMVGPSAVLAAAHCAHRNVVSAWIDTLVIRPGFDHASDLPGLPSARVRRIWHPRPWMESDYPGQNPIAYDWSILELDRPIGLEVGWLPIRSITSRDVGTYGHSLSYPGTAPCAISRPYPPDCDSISRSDTLFHTYGTIGSQDYYGYPLWFQAWYGESGSGLWKCSGDSCFALGPRTQMYQFVGLDSLAVGTIDRILSVITPPVSINHSPTAVSLKLRLVSIDGLLTIHFPQPGQVSIFDASGRSQGAYRVDSFLQFPSARLGHGLRLIIFHSRDGQVLQEKIFLP